MSRRWIRRSLRFSLGFLVATHLGLVASAQDSPGSESKSGVSSQSATLARIVANWQARQKRTVSLHVVFDTRMIEEPAGPPDARPKIFNAMRQEHWIDAQNRFCFEDFWDDRSAAKTVALSRQFRHAFDGTTDAAVNWQRGPGAPPKGRIFAPGSFPRLPEPLFLAFRPFSARMTGWRPDQLRLVTQDALFENARCVKLERMNDAGEVADYCWVDPSRNDIVVGRKKLLAGKDLMDVPSVISIQYRTDNEHGWVPSGWTESFLAWRPAIREEVTVAKFAINEKFGPSTFAPNFPPDIVVLDESANRAYFSVGDNSQPGKLNLRPVRPEILRLALDDKVDFSVERQPLTEALERVRLSYDLPMAVDQRTLAAAGIDPAAQVHANARGKTVADLLTTLLKESDPRAQFQIENGSIVFKLVR